MFVYGEAFSCLVPNDVCIAFFGNRLDKQGIS